MSFRDYLLHGWKLCNIQRGFKGPTGAAAKGWNRRENALTDPAVGPQIAGAGLLHAYSGTCALDVDNIEVASEWLMQRCGVDLSALRTAADSVHISSGRPGRCKLLYALPTPLASKKFAPYQAPSAKTGKPETYHGFELRCANSEGLSVQDVLPPSIHPDTGQPYQWWYGDDLAGHWSILPPLPETLRQLWLTELQPQVPAGTSAPVAPRGVGLDRLRELLAPEDPDADYETWIERGALIHHETRGSDDGLALWDEWSAKGSKYKGREDLEPHWRSFRLDVANPVTIGTLLQKAVAKPEAFPLVEPSVSPPNSGNRFRPVPPDEFMNRPPIRFIIEDVLPQAEIGGIFGAPGSGKTFFALDLAAAIARGHQWRDKRVRKGRVVYLAAEDPTGVALRMRAYKQQFGDCPIEVIPNSPNFIERNDIVELIQALQVGGPISVLFVDTLTNVTPMADEHSKEMAPAFEHAKTISKVTGALVMFIHHSGKDRAKGMRGWSGMVGYLDVEIEVTRFETNRTATITKGKNFADGEAFGFRLNRIDLGVFDERQTSSCVVEPVLASENRKPSEKIGANEQLALVVLRDIMRDGGVTVDEVWNEMRARKAGPLQRSRAEKALERLVIGGYVNVRDQTVTFPEVVA